MVTVHLNQTHLTNIKTKKKRQGITIIDPLLHSRPKDHHHPP
jgi:hypothetical protein